MADIEQTFQSVEAPGAYFSQDFSLETLNLLTSSGQKMELRRMVVEMSYYEDIYTFSISGYVTIRDSQGFIERLQLSGNEYLEIDFGKVKNGPNSDISTYRVYKIGNRAPEGNLNSEYYTLYFCSEELVLSEQIKISKSYSGQKISNIVKSVLTEKLKVDKKKIFEIEETSGLYDFVIPRMKPFEAISFITLYARPEFTGAVGADMLFFETKNGFNYRSLQSMFSENAYGTYKYQQSNIDDKTQPFQEKSISVLNYEFVKTYDAVNDITSGTYANRLISLDPISRTAKVTNFDYLNYEKNSVKLNKGPVMVPLKNRLGLAQNETFDASLKLATSNSSQKNEPYIKQAPGAIAKDIAIENYVPMRTAQLALANYTVLKIAIPGDPGITAGRTVNFNLMTIKPTDNSRDLDKFYSGKYLVTAVRHVMQSEGVYQTILEIAKESVPNYLGAINNSNPEWKEVVTE
jgi:hypothetical protein